MTRLTLTLIASLLVTSPALALDRELEAYLVSPVSGEEYINIADCDNPDSLELRATWGLPTGELLWDGTLSADVFISSSETCSSVSFEIGEDADENTDLYVDDAQADEFDFPEYDSDSYTLADLIDDSQMTCGSDVGDDYYLCIEFEYTYSDLYGDDQTDRYYGAAWLRIDFERPDAPTLDAVLAGEENLRVQWTAPDDDDDLAGFLVYYRPEGGEDDWRYKEVTNELSEEAQITGLSNYTTYEVVVAAYDLAANEGDASAFGTGTPVPIQDFYEYYGESGGGEDGGFCFVATAAYGAYDDAMVRELRGLRDEVLADSQTGRDFVAGYYRFGPRFARAIRHHDTSRTVARTSLLPAAGLATLRNAGPAEWVVLLSGLGIMIWLVVCFRRWLASAVGRATAAGLALVVGMGVLAAAPAAGAQELFLDEPAPAVPAEPRFQLQIRLGPYLPAVDSEVGLVGDPFEDVFGSNSELLFEFDLDYQLWRGFGAVTLGASFGFVQYVGKGRTEDGSTSADTTVFNLVPLRLTLGYHFTKLVDWWDVPLVPYVHGGLSYYVWWATDGVGDVAQWSVENGGTRDALGGIFGLHVGLGLKLMLDGVDESAAAALEREVGVINSYLFAEFDYNWVDGLGLGGHMNLGDDTFMFGLMFEF